MGSTVATVMGAVLIVVGLLLVTVQLAAALRLRRDLSREGLKRVERALPTRMIEARAGPVKLNLTTTYPGLVVVGLGVVLLVVGATT